MRPLSALGFLSPAAIAELEELIDRRVEERLAELERQAPATPYLSVDEAAAFLRCSRQHIYDLRSSGRLTRHGDGTRALVARAELEQLAADSHRVAPGAGRPHRERTSGVSG